ncbi:MAG: helix-turn-helix domain-containing protein, partial [Pyrinomonadaceae bacterium]
EYALAIGDGDELGVEDLPSDVMCDDSENSGVLKECMSSSAPLAEVERRYILSMFERFGKHHIKTATALGIDRRTLYRKLQQYGTVIDAEGSPFSM